MLHKLSYKDALIDFQKKFDIITPGRGAIAIAKDLWLEWEKSGITPPDINHIAGEDDRHQNGFFYEMIKLAEKIESTTLNIHPCLFVLDRYNAYALSTKDAYIILIDDRLFQLFFLLCVIMVFDSMNAINNKKEKDEAKEFVNKLITSSYFNREQIDISKTGIIQELLKKDYDLAEFSSYLFYALKAFVIAHEIAHHILKHTQGTMLKKFSGNGKTVTVEVDKRSIDCEFEADKYAYKLYQQLLDTTDGSVYHAYCKYRIYFAPLFLFDIFLRLDLLQEKMRKEPVLYNDHPHPQERINALVREYQLNDADEMYRYLKQSLDYFLFPDTGIIGNNSAGSSTS